jgi:hypothetical protein
MSTKDGCATPGIEKSLEKGYEQPWPVILQASCNECLFMEWKDVFAFMFFMMSAL